MKLTPVNIKLVLYVLRQIKFYAMVTILCTQNEIN